MLQAVVSNLLAPLEIERSQRGEGCNVLQGFVRQLRAVGETDALEAQQAARDGSTPPSPKLHDRSVNCDNLVSTEIC